LERPSFFDKLFKPSGQLTGADDSTNKNGAELQATVRMMKIYPVDIV